MRSTTTGLLCLLAAAGVACGGESGAFEACGGALTGSWSFTGATLEGAGDGCDPGGAPAIDGFIVFNENGRYSLNARVALWKRTPSEACGFATADGGFFAAEDRSVCLAGTAAELEATSCDGGAPYVDPPLRGAAEYCVAGDRLTLRSSSLLGLRFSAVLELARM